MLFHKLQDDTVHKVTNGILLCLLRLLKKWNNKMKISESPPYQISATFGGMFMDNSQQSTHSCTMSQHS